MAAWDTNEFFGDIITISGRGSMGLTVTDSISEHEYRAYRLAYPSRSS